jgi:hypothetical protein
VTAYEGRELAQHVLVVVCIALAAWRASSRETPLGSRLAAAGALFLLAPTFYLARLLDKRPIHLADTTWETGILVLRAGGGALAALALVRRRWPPVVARLGGAAIVSLTLGIAAWATYLCVLGLRGQPR